MTKQNTPSVLGIGNALVDVISVLKDDSMLEQFGLPRGSMTLVDANQSKTIYNATFSEESELATGGSVANSMRSLANMGGSAGYLGKIGRDNLGELFQNDFEKAGVRTHMIFSESDTGRVMGLVSPDSERTMATYLGAAAEMVPAEITSDIFKGYEYVYIEGYLVFNHALIQACADAAKEAGVKIALDLSSFNVVEANLDFLKNLIKDYVDILFANEEEAKSFTGMEPEEALHEISKDCEITIVKVGKKGSMIKTGDEVVRVGVIPAKAIDTTGAGDAYAAGFFYGLTKGYNMEISGKIAALISGRVVEVMGPNLPERDWQEVKAEIGKIVQG